MTPVVDTRSPRWDGALNLADLGGLPLRGGGHTAYGRVFRSGSPDSLTCAGWASLMAAGVTTVIDLRNQAERPSPGEPMPGVQIVPAPTEVPDDPVFIELCGPWLDHPRSYADNLRLFPALLAVAFRGIADAAGGVLIHCAGGRDRTGMVVALFLSLAGVTAEAIADDYTRACRGAGQQWPATDGDTASEHGMPERALALLEWLEGFDPAA